MQETEDERLIRAQACPLTASIHWDPKEDTKDDDMAWLRVYNKIAYSFKMGLVSEKTEEAIIKLAKKFDLYRVEEIGEISRIIRESFVKGVFDEKEIKERIVERLKLNEENAQKLFVELFKLRRQIATAEGSEVGVKLEKITLLEALRKFPEIKEQPIGERKIKISGENELKKQSITNWLDDYTLEKGAYPHSSLERSDYIFNSKNVDNLTFEEKRQLSLILESYDQESELTVDVDQKKILFNAGSGEDLQDLSANWKDETKEMFAENKKEKENVENLEEPQNNEVTKEGKVEVEDEKQTEKEEQEEFKEETIEPEIKPKEEFKKEEEERIEEKEERKEAENKEFFEKIDTDKEKKENKKQEVIEDGDKIQSKHIINLKDV